MPNPLAYLMLIAWPLISLVLFRKLPVERAILWSLFASYLILPPIAEFDLPLVPDMDKFSIPSVVAFGLCVFLVKKPVALLPRNPVGKVLTLLFAFSVVPTVLTNSDPILFRVLENSEPMIFITNMLPGLRWRDLGSVTINQMIILVPFLLGRQYLATAEAQRDLLIVFCIAALVYTLPSLVEIRLSPQTNTMIYGFFQHDFGQMMRQGGFRPIVFLPHALWLAIFMFSALAATVALARAADEREKTRFVAASVYLFVVLFMCKSLASFTYALTLVPFIALAPARWQMRVALTIAVIATVYPMLRNLGLVPVEAILMQAEAISADRAQSLGYRFYNEALMLERAAEKPWFGWGGWGRNLVRHAETGEIISVPDGRWIITFGTFGWLGYVAEMGLLSLPIVMLFWEIRRRAPDAADLSPYAAPIALILAATMLDMLLNDTLVPIIWLCAGAVLGHAENLRYGILQAKRPLFEGEQAILGTPSTTKKRSVL